MYKTLKGKTAFITGGTTGIGKEVALVLAEYGVNIVVAARKEPLGDDSVIKMVQEKGANALFIKCDIAQEIQVAEAINLTIKTYGSLDFALNNAGIGPDGKRIPFGNLTETSEDNFDKIVQTNFKGTFLCLKHEIIQMQKQGWGSIVNIASNGGIRMRPGMGAYGPSKAAVIALTKLAALENAKYSIRVNAVSPGPTKGTELMDNNLESNPQEEDFLMKHVIPMGRIGTTREIAKAVTWLFSEEASFTTGQVIPVDGGITI